MKLKSILCTFIAFGAMALMAVGVQAATYTAGTVSGEAGGAVNIPVSVTTGASETASINAYAMTFTYNPNLATPQVAGTDETGANCYASDMLTAVAGTTANTVMVADVIDTDTTDNVATLVVAWASSEAVTVNAATTQELAEVQFVVDASATDNVPVTVTAATVASDAATVEEVLAESLVSGEIQLASSYLLGDVNDDTNVNATDASWVLQYYVGAKELTSDEINRGNVNGSTDDNGNQTLNATDASLILQKYVGAILKFPIE